MSEPALVVDDIRFAECPRWRDGRLWFSDMDARRVYAFDPGTGARELIAEVPGRPAGLGWAQDGTLLVVSMADRRLLRLGAGGLEEVADLSSVQSHDCNDMVVSAAGHAYVGGFGFDLYAGERPVETVIALVQPDGSVGVAAGGLRFPNGMAISADGRTLMVGESYGGCITAFDVDPGTGALSNRRPYAVLDGATPDGICLDAEGAVWLGSPITEEFIRVREGGEVTERVATPGRWAVACTLGGPDRRTLYMCTAVTTMKGRAAEQGHGFIESVPVAVPGAGLP